MYDPKQETDPDRKPTKKQDPDTDPKKNYSGSTTLHTCEEKTSRFKYDVLNIFMQGLAAGSEAAAQRALRCGLLLYWYVSKRNRFLKKWMTFKNKDLRKF